MRRTGRAVLVAAALTLAGQHGTAHSSAAPEGGCEVTGSPVRYLVLFSPGTPHRTAADEARHACGELTRYHPDIAVGVAVSGHHRFSEQIGPHRAYSSDSEATGGTDDAAVTPVGDRSGRPHRVLRSEANLTAWQWNMRAIRADAAGAVERGDDSVVIGVLDSGIDPDHPELAGSLDPNSSVGCLSGSPDESPDAWRASTSEHGTHVAGILSAADDGRGVTGIAPGATVASVKVVDDDGRVSPEAAVCGLMWAAEHDFTLVNGSFLVAPWSGPCAAGPGHPVVRDALDRAVSHALSRGTLTVVAASNEGTELTPSPNADPGRGGHHTCEALPAGLRDAVSVSALDDTGRKAGYSSHGLGVIDLTAPGGGRHRCVLSTVSGGYGTLCGTSMAAPHVTGVAALVASHEPGLTARQLRSRLAATASPLPCPEDYDLTGNGIQDAYCTGYAGYNGFYGHGLVDAFAALTSPAE